MQVKTKKQIQKYPGIKEEVSLLKRIFQLISSGMDVNLEETIGRYGCSLAPPSLFEDGSMRRANKAVWLNAVLHETAIQTKDELPEDEPHCLTVDDAMYFLQRHAFTEGEKFQHY